MNEEAQESSEGRQTVEHWAKEKGYLPEWQATKAKARVGRHEVPGRRQNPQFYRFAQARAVNHWPEGHEITEAEFDQAIEDADAGVMR